MTAARLDVAIDRREMTLGRSPAAHASATSSGETCLLAAAKPSGSGGIDVPAAGLSQVLDPRIEAPAVAPGRSVLGANVRLSADEATRSGIQSGVPAAAVTPQSHTQRAFSSRQAV